MIWRRLLSLEEIPRVENVGVSGARPRAVLEILLAQANTSVSTERIVDELWGDGAPKTARNSVQRFVADLRKQIGDPRFQIETTPMGYRLQLRGTDDLDTLHRQVRADARSAIRSDPLRSIGVLSRAERALASSDAHPPSTPSGIDHQRRREELRLDLVGYRMEAELGTGRAIEVVVELEALASEHPYREQLHAQLMRALWYCGRRVDALRAFERLRRALAEHIGVEPSDGLRELERRILDGERPEIDGVESPDHPAGPSPLHAPDHRTASAIALFGRSGELAKLTDLVAGHWIVTVSGPGGVGKTTLAGALLERPDLHHFDRVVTVRLSEVSEPDAVSAVMADALGLTVTGDSPSDRLDAIAHELNRSRALVMIDNAEHVIDGVRDLVRLVGGMGPRSHLLITSQQRLGLPSEAVLALQPLDTNAGGSPAEALFRARAAAVGADLEGHDTEISTICRELDGLPLSLELAASQLVHLGVRDLAERLDRRFELLADARPEGRHGRLSTLMAWSWDLLEPSEIALLYRLAVFRGRLNPTTIESLGGMAALRTVHALVLKSLVAASVEDGRASFSLLETVRHYAMDKAKQEGALGAARDAHCEYLIRYLRQWSLPELNNWTDTVEKIAEHRHEYAPALEWLDDQGRSSELVELVVRAHGLWARRGPGGELVRWSARAEHHAPSADLDHESQCALLVVNAEAAHRQGHIERLATYADRLIELDEKQTSDLGTPFIAFYGTACHLFTLSPRHRATVETANRRALRTTSARLNRFQTEMWVGCCQLFERDFAGSIDTFTRVLEAVERPGGVVLWSELGLVTAHLCQDEVELAVEAMNRARSHPDDTVWNYASDIIRSVVTAATGDHALALTSLVAVAEQTRRDQLVGRRDDFEIGFGLLAYHRGDVELGRRLLATPIGRSPVTTTLLMNALHPEPTTPAEWRRLWAKEIGGRMVAAGSDQNAEPSSLAVEIERWADRPRRTGPDHQIRD